jgi:GxxExxY protein
MNTDGSVDLRETKNPALLFKSETKSIIGCAFEVSNGIGHGLHEKIYENALTVVFRQRGIPFDQQRRFPVVFLGETVGEFAPDLLVFDAVVSDVKVIDQITDYERGQMLNYLKITRKRVGLILNFKHPTLQWDRMVL